jgi:hypothetical protein
MNNPDHFLFHYYELGKESSLIHTRFIFNCAEHLRLQQAKNWRIYELLDQQANVVIARIAFHMDGDKARSPFRAPFGFIEFFGNIIESELAVFFSLIEADLKARGIKKIQLKSYPEIYDSRFSMAEAALKQLKYAVSHELSSVIPVDRKPFVKKIKISERQKLRKAEKLFSFEKLKNSQLQDVYAFIEGCRRERDQSLSMSFSDLGKTVRTFPENFLLYRVYDDSGTAAAVIAIKVSKEILYTFYYAHARKFDKVSPVVFLISSLYKLAQMQHIAFIDLGTSMVNGKVNRSLLHFKKSIGGESNRKLIFEKDLM